MIFSLRKITRCGCESLEGSCVLCGHLRNEDLAEQMRLCIHNIIKWSGTASCN